MFELTIEGHMASAHFLRGYKGKCRKIHGHNWKVEVTLRGGKLNPMGMLMDFSVLKRKFKTFLAKLDHAYLNEIRPFNSINPTTEHIAKYIYDNFSTRIRPLTIKQVRVWESDSASATYYKE